jgi:2-dehydropantoate 2-reductase
MRIAVVGTGAVGGYFGARLAQAGADVSFVARGAQLDALRTRGLRILSPKGDLHLTHVTATDRPATLAPVDVVLFTVKLYDVESAIALLPPLLGSETIVLPFQNGVESVDLVTQAVGRRHAGGGTCYLAAVTVEPGVIRHTAMGQLIFGELDGARSERLESLLEACRKSNFESTLSTDINVDIWTKFTRLSVFSGLTAAARSPIGEVVGDPDLLQTLEAALGEAVAVARARGIPIPDSFAEDVRAYKALAPGTKSSMLEDLERGRRLELPWLSGAVVRFGAELGVPTPTHRFIQAVLKPHVNGHPSAA